MIVHGTIPLFMRIQREEIRKILEERKERSKRNPGETKSRNPGRGKKRNPVASKRKRNPGASKKEAEKKSIDKVSIP